MSLSPSVVELEGPWSHEYLHTRGVRLHAAVLGEQSAPLMVLIHGSIGGWFDFSHAIEPLAQAGFRVAAIDLRGYGLSDKPPVEKGQDIRTLVGDITGLIQALGHEQAFLVGVDTGASLAWTVAAERPERVTGVVSISGAHPTDMRPAVISHPWDFGWIIVRELISLLPLAVIRHLPLRAMTAGDAQLNSYHAPHWLVDLRLKAIEIENSCRGTVWNHRLLTASLPLGYRAARVSAPVLFLHADQRLWGPVVARARRRAKNLQISHIPDTKNLPHAENPAGFARAISAWAHGAAFI